VAVADVTTGMYATVAMIANMNMNYLVSGRIPQRVGNAHANIVPYQVFDAADGQLVLAVGNDSQFAKFCEVAGCAFHQDARFRKNADRVRNREVLVPLLAEVLRRRGVQEWVALLEPRGVPVGPINDLAQVFDHPQVRARGLRVDLPHPLSGSVPMVASPIKMSATPVRYDRAPPVLGQHTSEVLREYGVSEGELRELAARGIV
jgi:crotonobetainyl-CoA:carnitine CoA-transferase CaiB-like acyl-CoA transferase